MIIKNYEPERIKQELNALKEQIYQKNKKTEKRFKLKSYFLVPINAILFICALLALLWTFRNPTTWQIIILVISGCIAIATLVFSVIWWIEGPEYESINQHITFEMEFYNLHDKTHVLNIHQSSKNQNIIIIEYENDLKFVHKRRLIANSVISTETNEIYLDVKNGYIVTPYKTNKKENLL